jgi:peptidoglycan hydrolase-like protein with peptidoglycan-binding domain
MGKVPTSLLVIIFQLFFANDVFASEQVRQVQEELRKRHLFHGNVTGETSPALTTAVRRYQQIKGFARTGVLDSETSASLGIVQPPVPTRTPFVVDSHGEIRGENGEALPSPLPSRWTANERAAQFDRAMLAQDHVSIALAGSDIEGLLKKEIPAKRRSPGLIPRARARKQTNPFVQAFNSVDHAMKFLLGDSDAKKKRRPAKRL